MSKCPECKSDKAYIGLREVECINDKCKYFSMKWALENWVLEPEELKQPDPISDPDKTPPYPFKITWP